MICQFAMPYVSFNINIPIWFSFDIAYFKLRQYLDRDVNIHELQQNIISQSCHDSIGTLCSYSLTPQE